MEIKQKMNGMQEKYFQLTTFRTVCYSFFINKKPLLGGILFHLVN